MQTKTGNTPTYSDLNVQSMQVGREVVRHMLFDVIMPMSKSNINFEKWPTVSFSFSITEQDFSILSVRQIR